jgi:hypothetical protein
MEAHGRFIEHMSEYLNTSDISRLVTDVPGPSSVRPEGVQDALHSFWGSPCRVNCGGSISLRNPLRQEARQEEFENLRALCQHLIDICETCVCEEIGGG